MAAVCKRLRISDVTLHRWRVKYGAMKQDEAARLRVLETENGQLKRLVAEKELELMIMKDVAEGNLSARRAGERRWRMWSVATSCLSSGGVGSLVSTARPSVMSRNARIWTRRWRRSFVACRGIIVRGVTRWPTSICGERGGW